MSHLPTYHELASELLEVEQLALALPRWPKNPGDPVHYPGGLTDYDELALQSEVCRLTAHLPNAPKCSDWPKTDESQRIVWMQLAVDVRRERSKSSTPRSDPEITDSQSVWPATTPSIAQASPPTTVVPQVSILPSDQSPSAPPVVQRAAESQPDPAATPMPKRRGRKKADYETVQREFKLVDDWIRARDAGTPKVDFAKELEFNLKDFDALLDRVGKRKRHYE